MRQGNKCVEPPLTAGDASANQRRAMGGILLLISAVALASSLYALAPPETRDGARRHWAAWSKGAQYKGLQDVTLQTHRTNCGPAALHMALARLGIHRPLEAIEASTGTDRSGTSLFALGRYAEDQGVGAALWHLNMDDLVERNQLPAIAFVENNHFVVIDSIGHGGDLWLRDPAIGQLHMTRAAFQRIWQGEVILLNAP